MTSVNVTTQKNTVTVNGETSVVTVTVAGPQGASGPQGPSVSDGDKGAITVSNSGTTFAVNDDVITTSKIADDAVTADKLANSINTEIAANTAKVSNATHTGDVTGSTALTIADDAVTYAKIQNVSATDRVLGRDSSGAGVVEEITPANLRTMINVEDGATGDQTAAEIRTLVESASDSNVFTDADHTKLNGVETNATADQTDAEIKTAYENNSNTNAYTDAEKSKLAAIEASADVTDATNVDAAGAVMNSDNTTAAMSFVVDEDNMSSDSATKVPTQQSVKAYVDAEVADIVNSAPSNLDTLKELSDALGSDANFSTTVTNNIATKLPLAGGTMTGNIVMSGSQTVDGRDVSADGAKLDGIESGATADQTDAEIRAAVEAASDSNVFTDADHTKLNGIEASATADQTDAEIKTAYENNSDTNAFTDAEKTKLAGIEASADVTDATNVAAAGAAMLSGAAFTGDITFGDTDKAIFGDGGDFEVFHSGNGSFIKDAGVGPLQILTNSLIIRNAANNEELIEAGENAGVKLYYNDILKFETLSSGVDITGDISVSGTVDGRDVAADGTKLDGIETSATADQTGAEIKSLYEGESDTNAFTDAEKTKLSGIETNATADQTASEIRTLVENASDSNVFTDADHTKLNGIAANANVGITDLVSDTSPQLGGDLDMNSNFISSGILGIKNQGAQSEVRLYCESNNAHYAGIKAPAHADFSGDLSFTLPSGYGSNGQVLQSNGSGGTSWVAHTPAYTNSSVDSHLNTSSASSGQILSWNGSDYAWVADQTGGGGGGISNLVEDTTPQLGGNLDMQTNNISGTGTVIANSTAVATAGMRKIHLSSSAPSGSDGAVGDIWVKY